MCKQMIDIKKNYYYSITILEALKVCHKYLIELLVFEKNTWNNLIVCK